MPIPQFPTTAWQWSTRQILQFGGNAIPVLTTLTAPWLDLNDAISFFTDDIQIEGTPRIIQVEPLVWRAKGIYISDDFRPKTIKLKGQFDENGGVLWTHAKALLTQMGEQYLTFDNATAILVKIHSVHSDKSKLIQKFPPYRWEYEIDFIAKTPWAQDLQQSGSLSNLLNPNGGFEISGITQAFWKSIGTDATGTLTFWAIDTGVPTITSNVVTMPAGSQMRGGHPDWWNLTNVQAQFVFSTNSQPFLLLHAPSSNSWVRVRVDGTNIHLDKDVSGTITNDVVSVVPASLVNGQKYWLTGVISGVTFTGSILNDTSSSLSIITTSIVTADKARRSRDSFNRPSPIRSNSRMVIPALVSNITTNSPGTVIATISGVISDSTLATGQIGLGNNGTASCTFGSANPNVCLVQGTGPQGWTPTVVAGEPAFVQSKAQAQTGAFSASIFLPAGVASTNFGYWNNTIPLTNGLTYALDGFIRGTGITGTGADFSLSDGVTSSIFPAAEFTGGVWTEIKGTKTAGNTGGGLQTRLQGPGTVYFDSIVIQQAFDVTHGLYVPSFLDQIQLGGGTTGTQTTFTINYLGDVFTEPTFQFNVSSINPATISQFAIKNSTSSETLTINFSPVLSAMTAYTLIIDCANFKAKIGATEYDISGSFPMIYPNATSSQGTNTFTVTVTTGTGTASGLSLDYSFLNRWEI